MLGGILKKIFGTSNSRKIKVMLPTVELINAKEVEYQSLTDEQLKAKTQEFKQRIADGETLDDLVVEAFAVVKNACRRLAGTTVDLCGQEQVWQMVPFDVQIVGGLVIHKGSIAEMATGEGKTLVATMPVYLNALSGKGVHLVTVNDYLARRDSQWMGTVYRYLGLSVGCLQNDMNNEDRRDIYNCDIVYGTNSEFGFDYLRDNGQMNASGRVQRGHNFAIIDEVDSILIDEARTPLIISGPVAVSTHKYDKLRPRVSELVHKQTVLCNRLVAEAKQLLDDDNEDDAVVKLFQVQHSVPKHKQFMKLCEQPSIKKMLERFDLEIHTDLRKKELRDIYEEMFFVMDEKHHDVHITERGREELSPEDIQEFVMPDVISSIQEIDSNEDIAEEDKVERKKQLYAQAEETSEKVHNLTQLLKAYCLFEKDISYVVQDGEVMIVDEYTGRLMPGRRYSDGLHQAIEAKENVKIERETQTLATITIQNYFRMYEKLSGMTGTAETEAEEFLQIYKLPVVVIPTNRPVLRTDGNDVIYKTRREKYNAIVAEIEQEHAKKRPVLVGTVSVESSELLSRLLKRRNIPHSVLNAKYHEREAEIVSLAGQPGAVTIATNMAGRGTDIKLGDGVPDTGGLHVIGTERHESRRIDRQLRGRCARQGDPGSSCFYVSLEDDLMRLFGSDRVASVMTRLGLEEGQELAHPLLSRNIEMAQKRVEKQNFHIRKHVLKYDDVMNKQREIIYKFRDQAMDSDDLSEMVLEILDEVVDVKCDELVPEKTSFEEFDIDGLKAWVLSTFFMPLDVDEDECFRREMLIGCVKDAVEKAFEMKSRFEGTENMVVLERINLLMVIDRHWKEHLYNMDALRDSVNLRAYGQSDPLLEYKREAFDAFSNLIFEIKDEFIRVLFQTSVTRAEQQREEENYLAREKTSTQHESLKSFGAAQAASAKPAAQAQPDPAMQPAASKSQTFHRDFDKVGRNDPCPCGSGKKYKKCCLDK